MSKIRSIGTFTLLGVLWGSSFVAIEAGLPYFPPLLFAALRYYVAGIAILVYAFLTVDYCWPRSSRDWIVIGIAGAFLIGGHHAFLYIGQQFVSGAIAAVVISLGPILTTVFATVLLDDSMTFPVIVGLTLGLVGVVLVSNFSLSTAISSDAIGVGLVFVSAGLFALGSVLTRPFRTAMPVQSMQAWAMLIGAGLLHVVGFVTGESIGMVNWTFPAILSLSHLGVVSGAIAFLLYFQLLDQHGPAEINLIGYLEPVAATILSWILFNQLIELTTLLGFTAIFTGFVLIKKDALTDVYTST